jgi:hypothetical protein
LWLNGAIRKTIFQKICDEMTQQTISNWIMQKVKTSRVKTTFRPVAVRHFGRHLDAVFRHYVFRRAEGKTWRNIMRKNAYRSAITAAFLGSVAVATAAELNLTAQQKQTILQSVQTEKGQPAPAGFLPRVGAPVPQSMSMRRLPPNVTTQVPVTKDLEYTILDNNEVLLIDPKDRRVAEIIMPSGTTGAAPAPISPAPIAPR